MKERIGVVDNDNIAGDNGKDKLTSGKRGDCSR